MNFTSPLFAFIVLPAVLGGYWLCPRRWQNAFLLAVGIGLYAWGAPEFVLVVLALAAFDWLLAFRIAAAPDGSKARKSLTVLGVGTNLAVLAVAKYANFGAGIVNDARSIFGVSSFAWTDIALPIGVSFVIFEKISYLVDVSRGTVRPLRSLPTYLLYTFLFPKMLAGPIVRFHTIEKQLLTRRVDDADRAYGLSRFVLGFAKKVLIADTLGGVANAVYGVPTDQLNMPTAWLGATCFALQVYFDFSGYSDIAIGLSRCFGFRLLENFRYPYAATSPQKYWAGWHLSLSSWIRDYLYIPLGGNRHGELRTHVNLWICFLSCGLWHGANWTYLAWGAWQGVALTIERHYRRHVSRAMPKAIAVALTFTFVVLSLVVFRSPSVADAVKYYRAMFVVPHVFFIQIIVDNTVWLALGVALAVSFAPALPGFSRMVERLAEAGRIESTMKACALPLLALAAVRLLGFDATPFIYFRF